MSGQELTVSFLPMHYDGRSIRLWIDERGFPWWVAQDICESLGLENVSQAVARLQVNEKRTITNPNASQLGLKLIIINEPGMYRLVFRSNKPEAIAFQNWVYWEVLPTLRRGQQEEAPQLESALAQILERMDARLSALEMLGKERQPGPQPTRLSPMPAPKPRRREHAEISLHLVAVWRVLRDAETALDNREISRLSGIGERTTRAHTRYLLQLGFIDVYETFPRHLYVVTTDEHIQQSAYWQRLEHITAIFEARHRLTYEELQLLGKEAKYQRS